MDKKIGYAEQMRQNPTFAEKRMITRLQEEEIEFVFQYIIGNYIVDFLITNRKTILEMDGSSHNKKVAYDLARDRYLRSCGYRVIHINNEFVESFKVSKLRDKPHVHKWINTAPKTIESRKHYLVKQWHKQNRVSKY